MASFCSSRDELAVTRVLAVAAQRPGDLIEAHRIFKHERLFPQSRLDRRMSGRRGAWPGAVKTWEVTGSATPEELRALISKPRSPEWRSLLEPGIEGRHLVLSGLVMTRARCAIEK